MRELKKFETIIKNAPEISASDIEQINSVFMPYIFYKTDKKDRAQHCVCSYCREHFTVSELQRTLAPEDREFLSATHNKFVKCPKCGVTAKKKQIGIARDCANLSEYQRTVFVKRRSEQEVYLIYSYNSKEYSKPPLFESEKGFVKNIEYDTLPKASVEAIYYLTPNQQRVFIRSPYSRKWEEKKIAEPYTKTYYYNIMCPGKGYTIVGLDALRDTFLRYFDYEKFKRIFSSYAEFPFCKTISLFAKYKSFEFLAKQGYGEFVRGIVFNPSVEAPTLYDWQATTPYKFFKKLSKSEIKEMKEKNVCTRSDINGYLKLRSSDKKISVDEYAQLAEAGSYRISSLEKMMKKHKISAKEMLKFLNNRENFRPKQVYGELKYYKMSSWLDYIEAAEACGYDLTVHNVLFPKNLNTAHDEAVAIREQVRFENEKRSQAEKLKEEQDALNDKNNSYAKRYKKLQKAYEYADGKYCIVIPKGATEIVLEGKALKHCVGGYAERHIKGKTTILFMRTVENSDESLLTIELDEKRLVIIQVHGLGNRNPSAEEQAFIDKWLENVKQRKNKKSSKKKVA